MSGVHKNPTISSRISEREREEIEAKIEVSGLNKKEYKMFHFISIYSYRYA